MHQRKQTLLNAMSSFEERLRLHHIIAKGKEKKTVDVPNYSATKRTSNEITRRNPPHLLHFAKQANDECTISY
eukprot:scaffold3900_cov76-Cylindrotheca_fusiformis.AAC.1